MPPNTSGFGDKSTAWASATQDDQQEWLQLEYEKSVVPTAILVHETYGPGAVTKVTHVPMWGKEEVLWEGKDPTPVGSAGGVSRLPVTAFARTGRIKVYINSPAVSGWNEIDAVGLRSKEDNMQWAMKVVASTTYAQQEFEPAPPMVVVPLEQLQRLQQDVEDLKKELERMKQMEADIKELKELIKDLKK